MIGTLEEVQIIKMIIINEHKNHSPASAADSVIGVRSSDYELSSVAV